MNSILLIDEIDSLLFADSPVIIGSKFLSAIILLNKYKIIGMTATFRGDQGLNVMQALLRDSVVIKTGAIEPERTLELDVFGKLKPI